MKKTTLILSLLLALISTEAVSKVRLPQVISDCMLLQRNTENKIWGWAEPGEKVTVRFDGEHWFTSADSEGSWEVTLPAHKAGGPYLLEINEIILRDILVGDLWLLSGQSNQETPIERLLDRYPEINYSNNHMVRMYKVPTQNTPGELREDIPSGERWHSAIASDVLNWKALAYWFAILAYEQTGIPQGMLISSLGGSAIEQWIPEDRLLRFDDQAELKRRADAAVAERSDKGQGLWMREDFDDSSWDSISNPTYLADAGIKPGVVIWYRKTIDVPESMAGRHAKIYMGRLVDGDEVYVNGTLVGSTGYFGPPRKYDVPAGLLHEGRNVVTVRLTANASDAGFVPDKPYKLVGDEAEIDLRGEWKYKIGMQTRREGFGPGMGRSAGFIGAGLYNGMVAPLLNCSFAGMIWYQGETNADRAEIYDEQLTALIESWREELNDPDLPVLICQLPNYMEKFDRPVDEDWARLREAQFKVYRQVPYTYLATSYHTGEWNDIHPLNKKDLAATLLLGARQLCYGEDIDAMGPVFREMKVDGNRIILYFDHARGGLKTSDGGRLRHFAVAGEDGHFVWADAVIKGSTVIVSSPEVSHPVNVRYGWANNPEEANLCGRNGVLASPFRTDNYPKKHETNTVTDFGPGA